MLAIRPAIAQEVRVEPTLSSDNDGEAVIVPGKEELFADMLGRAAALPGGCEFTAGQAERTFIKATYKCAAGEVFFELRHPSTVTNPVATTAHFGIVLVSGTPPAGLVDDIVARVRARESEFEWKRLQGTRQPPASNRNTTVLVAAGLLAIVAIAWLVRRRSAARPAS